MKKALIFTLVFMLTVVNSSVALAAGIGIDTTLTPDTSGGTAPVVQAKWEAKIDKYSDDSTNAGAQFMPTGVKDGSRTISICAIVSDPDGLPDIKHVYADVYYPVDIAVGPSHKKLTSQTGSDTAGCGVLMQEDELNVLSKDAGYALFCGDVKTFNNSLPTFASGYDYSAICKADGTLQKETAKVYCVNKNLSYEDPSGEYRVKAVAVDAAGQKGKLENHFDYLAMTAFETDFNSISYGNVRLETEKIINGDLTWGTPLATVRNVGNTRVAISVNQDDMNFGKTGLNWNVSYRARVGNMEGDWTGYDPDETVTLKDDLDLSEFDEMDFAIYAKKFPDDVTAYEGTMTLGAVSAPHLACAPKVGAKLAYVAPTNCNFTVNSGESIQIAINAATAGDTICVADGTYTGPIDINKNVTLVSINGSSLTTINGGIRTISSDVTVKGFTINVGIVPAEPNPVGFYINGGSNITIDSNNIIGNGLDSRGVLFVTGANYVNVKVTNNKIHNNNSGIYTNPHTGNIDITYNDIYDNNAGIGGLMGATVQYNEFTHTIAGSEAIGTDSSYDLGVATTNFNNFLNGTMINDWGAVAVVSAENNFFNTGGVNQTTAGQVDFTPETGVQYAHN